MHPIQQIVLSDEPNGCDGRLKWMLLGFCVLLFFFMLGGRSLNEPDEGRYSEVAREMIETGNWLTPQIWYVPHIDKPPLTYWLVAISMSLFGQNEWAVRFPLALAGLSGIGAAWCLGGLIGGARVAFFSGMILATSMLYFVMARMLTTDIILTQFIAWAVFFLWQAWRARPGGEAHRERSAAALLWHAAGWLMMALGFLAKGPIAVILPLLAVTAMIVSQRRRCASWRGAVVGTLLGLALFCAVVLPWFLLLFQTVPHSWEYMTKGQFLGHALGTAIKNRKGSPFYYIGVVAAGWLPWTLLLGWLWRRAHWRTLAGTQKEGWILLSVLSVCAFVMFSAMKAKLPAYILPVFPCLAVLTAARFCAQDKEPHAAPRWVWRGVLLSPFALALIAALAVRFVFNAPGFPWLYTQAAFAVAGGGIVLFLARDWTPLKCVRFAMLFSVIHFFVVASSMHTVEDRLKGNQPFKSLGQAIKAHWKEGTKLVCWGRFPQGLPFYAYPAISASQKPFLGGLPLNRVPFEFPGNKEAMADKLLPDLAALLQLLDREERVLIAGFKGTFESLRPSGKPVRLILKSGDWELIGTGGE
jgi:4-amino-4-deoxy-L-arabinose transferase-like glycosyltransferase